jgi:polar amino acid transport system permease protein
MTVSSATPAPAPPTRHAVNSLMDRLPYWLLVAMLLGVLMLWRIFTDETYTAIFNYVARGVVVTVVVTLVAFTGAIVVGLLVGIARVSKNRVVYEVSTFYVEIIRGIPMLVLLLYIAFVLAPAAVLAVNWVGEQLLALGLTTLGGALAGFPVRNFDFAARAVIALVIGYSAFISEIFRGGIRLLVASP